MGEIAGIAHGVWVVEGCGAMRERKLGVKWDEIPIFHSPISPIFPEVNDLPPSSLCKHQRTALTDGKMRTFATHQHSPPQRMPAHAHRTQPLSATLSPRPPPPPDPITRPKAGPRSAFSKGQPCHPPARSPVAAQHSTYNPQPVKGRGGAQSQHLVSVHLDHVACDLKGHGIGRRCRTCNTQTRPERPSPRHINGGFEHIAPSCSTDLSCRGVGGWLATLCFWEGVAARCANGARAARTAFNTCTSLVLGGRFLPICYLGIQLCDLESKLCDVGCQRRS